MADIVFIHMVFSANERLGSTVSSKVSSKAIVHADVNIVMYHIPLGHMLLQKR